MSSPLLMLLRGRTAVSPYLAAYSFASNSLPSGTSLTRSSTATYIDRSDAQLRFAAIDEARFENGCLLLEPQRTNYVLNNFWTSSNTLGYWTRTSATAVVYTPSAINSSYNAAHCMNGRIWSSSTILPSAGYYTASVYVESVLTKCTSGIQDVNYTYAVSNTQTELNTGSIGSFYNRKSFFVSTDLDGYYIFGDVLLSSGDCSISYPQVENGPNATSRILTGTTAATRASDFYTIPFPIGAQTIRVIFDDLSIQEIDVSSYVGSTYTFDPEDLDRYHIKNIYILGSAIIPEPENYLRVIAVNQRTPNYYSSSSYSGQTAIAQRWAYLIATDSSSLALVFTGFYNTDDKYHTPFTVNKVSIELDDGSVHPVYFNGSRSLVVNGGACVYESDEIQATDIGLTKFEKGKIIYVKWQGSGTYFPFTTDSAKSAAEYSGQRSYFYNSSTFFPSDVDVAGVFTFTGSGYLSTTGGLAPIMVGKPISSSDPSFIVTGDSIAYGQGDTRGAGTVSIYGRGFAASSMYNTDKSVFLPSINTAEAGWTIASYTKDTRAWATLVKYARFAVDELGTNDLNNVPAQGAEDIAPLVWNELRANGIEKIVRTNIITKSNSTDSWATLANQTIRSDFVSGGRSDLFNQWLVTQVGTSIDYYVDTKSTVADGTETFKWAVNGTANYPTTDGVHPTSVNHEKMAVPLRLVTLTLT